MPDSPFHIQATEMDFKTLVEAGYLPPIAFPDRAALSAWARACGLEMRPVGRCRKGNIAFLTGQITLPGGRARYYSQYWVRASYQGYRRAISAQLARSRDSLEGLGNFDMDHAVSRARLMRSWPHSWVTVILARSKINRAIGALMERQCGPLEGDCEGANAEFLLKLLCREKGALSAAGLQAYMDRLATAFLDQTHDRQSLIETRNADRILNDIAKRAGFQSIRPVMRRPDSAARFAGATFSLRP